MTDLGLRERRIRAAQNQSLFRAVNERLENLAEAFQFVAQTASFACECADKRCVSRMSMKMSEYEELRNERPDRFAVLPGHIDAAVEGIVAQNERFWVVEKIGVGADVARENDPRG